MGVQIVGGDRGKSSSHHMSLYTNKFGWTNAQEHIILSLSMVNRHIEYKDPHSLARDTKHTALKQSKQLDLQIEVSNAVIIQMWFMSIYESID